MNYEPLAKFIKELYGADSPRGLYGNRRILSDWTVRDLGFAVHEFRRAAPARLTVPTS